MRIYDIIYKKREGEKLSREEIHYFVHEYTKGNIPDYQAAALLMTIFFQHMDQEETFHLTEAMMLSGDMVDLSRIEGIKVDKHSTGGVGDTTTLVVGPIVAACGVPVAKMSGRGLGHTGGTIDKLESIEGFHVELTTKQFIEQVNNVKLAVIGQSMDLAPADKKLYALRDVTATVDNVSLIAGSIMSKKLAAGSDAIVLDVKVGSGAFMKDIDRAVTLAKEMVNIGKHMNKETIAVITSMEQPLGCAVGNSLEVIEAIDTLNGNGPADLQELSITLASHMIYLSKKTADLEAARELAIEKLNNGEALLKFKEFVHAQGGDVTFIDQVDKFLKAEFAVDVKSKRKGYIESIKTDDVGIAALILGAGRENKSSQIDLSAGLRIHKKIGNWVEEGDILATIYTNKEEAISQATSMIQSAFECSNHIVDKYKLIKAVVTKEDVIIM